MPDIRTLIYFVIVVVVVFGLTLWILRNIAMDAMIKNIILAVEGLVFLLWFLSIIGVI